MKFLQHGHLKPELLTIYLLLAGCYSVFLDFSPEWLTDIY